MTAYQDRVNAERLARQAPDVQKAASALLNELVNARMYLFWSLDPEERGDYYCQTLIDHAHMIIDQAHEFRAALRANPSPPEESDDAA